MIDVFYVVCLTDSGSVSVSVNGILFYRQIFDELRTTRKYVRF